jgi:hypothetical protein
MEAPLKGLYALAFVFSAFASCAQAQDVPTTLFFDLDDYFGELTELSTLAPQSITTEPTMARSGEAVTNEKEDAPVGAIQPTQESASIPSPIWWDDRLGFDEVTEPTTVPAQIIIPELSTEKFGQSFEKSDDTTGALTEKQAADIQVGGIDHRYQTATTALSTSEDQMTVDEAIGQGGWLPLAL